MTAARSRVLSAFKELHRTVQSVFASDTEALTAGRLKINSEFKRFKDEKQHKKIEDHIQWARDTSRLLRLTVVQGRLSADSKKYEMRITKDTYFGDNVIFDPDADIPVKPGHKKSRCVNPYDLNIGKMSGKSKAKS